MAMAQLTGRNSLGDIVEKFCALAYRFYHLGSISLSRSNLSRINDAKQYALYEVLFGVLLQRCQGADPGHYFRFNNPLCSLDASTIDLCLNVFSWADFRTTKGAINLHVSLNHAGYLPEILAVTAWKKHDVTVGRTLKIPKGSIVAVDKGYNDYAWYKKLTDNGIFFLTHLKTNAQYRIVSRRKVPKGKGLNCDQ